MTGVVVPSKPMVWGVSAVKTRLAVAAEPGGAWTTAVQVPVVGAARV